MPSTDDPGPLDGLSYSAAEWRRMDALGFMANGAAGGAVTVAAQAKYGIPCVY